MNGLRQRFVILPNDHKREGGRDPDYVLMSSDEPEVDTYARQPASTPRQPQPEAREPFQATDADLPF